MVDVIGAGRAFGQRLGKLQEHEIGRIVTECLYGTDFVFIPKGLLPDVRGKMCAHDGLVVGADGRPYAIIESKLVQKAKHATEKAAKVAREHPALKRAHPTLRASIAVLSGDFTPEPLRMVEQSGAHLLFVPQEHVINVCRDFGLDILWQDREAASRAVAALEQYNRLTSAEIRELGRRMLEPIADHLARIVLAAIADIEENPIIGVWVDIFFQRGEIGHHEFNSVEEALSFLSSWG